MKSKEEILVQINTLEEKSSEFLSISKNKSDESFVMFISAQGMIKILEWVLEDEK